MILSIQRRKEALHVGDLGKVIDDDIRIMRMSGQEVLMIALRGIKAGVLFNTGDYGLAKRMRGRQLRDISPGHVSLRGAGRENRRAVLSSGIRPLPLQLGGVVDRKSTRLNSSH